MSIKKEKQTVQMVRKFKNILSVSLAFLFLVPLTVKILDSFFHHHDHPICIAQKENYFQVDHAKCPILHFELSLYSIEKQFFGFKRLYYHLNHTIISSSSNYFSSQKYLFLLRAPPVFTEPPKTS
jgi:hypothetical protein